MGRPDPRGGFSFCYTKASVKKYKTQHNLLGAYLKINHSDELINPLRQLTAFNLEYKQHARQPIQNHRN